MPLQFDKDLILPGEPVLINADTLGVADVKITDDKEGKPRRVDLALYDDEGYAYGTMVLTWITMHALFDGAVQSEILTKNPADGLKCKQRDVKEARVLTRQEQEEFLEYCKGCMYYNAYVLFLQTGLRPGELGGLKWEGINLEKRELHVERTLLQDKSKGGFYFGSPKNKMSKRTVPLTEAAIKILKDQRIYQFKLRQRSNNWQKKKEFDNLVFCTVNNLIILPL